MNYISLAKKCPLFEGIDDIDLPTMFKCLAAIESQYEKNNFIFNAGDRISNIGILLSGGAHVIMDDFWVTKLLR